MGTCCGSSKKCDFFPFDTNSLKSELQTIFEPVSDEYKIDELIDEYKIDELVPWKQPFGMLSGLSVNAFNARFVLVRVRKHYF